MTRVIAKKKERPQNLKTFIKGVLRRATYLWKPRNQALTNARVSRGKYSCAECKDLFGPKELAIDHIYPVIDPRKGFTTWDDYIERLFCDVDKFQVLCHACHDNKTKIEDVMREHYKTEKEEFIDTTTQQKKLDKRLEEEG